MKNSEFETKKSKPSSKPKEKKEKPLPWWVELLFVQIGLPDKFLLKILKSKKYLKIKIQNNKKFIFTFLFLLGGFAYFNPIVKNAKNKIECYSNAKSYILQNKKLIQFNEKQIKMLSTNFCNGGEEIYKIHNRKQ